MATKTAEKKSISRKAGAAAPAQDPQQTLANELLLNLLHRALVRLGEPARVGEITREVGEDAVSPGLARHMMAAHPRRFVAVDRRWDIAARYLDKQRPVEWALEELISLYAVPMPSTEVAGELSHVYGRVREYFNDVAPRLLQGHRFFPVDNGLAYGLRSWLLDTEAGAEADVLFYNFLTPEAIRPFEAMARTLDWETNPAGAARQLIAAGDQPVDNRIVQFFAWRALGDEFDPVALFDALYAERDALVYLPDYRWLPQEALEPLRARWRAQAAEVIDLPVEEPAAEVAPEIPAKPLEITEADLEDIRHYFDGREEIVTPGELLTQVFDIRPGQRSFAGDVETLSAFLRSRSDEFLWVGTDRFRALETLPPYIGQLPESLTFPVLPRFETPDGEILDQMLADTGFEEGLLEEILDPVAQDVNDQEPPQVTRWPEGASAGAPRLRLVLKSHHKEIGTFPLAQVPPGFFPTEPNIVELTLRDQAGVTYPIYVDYDVQLIYGLFDVYGEIAADSGAVFFLEKTENPAEYRFVFSNETDPGVFVGPERFQELADFRSEVESGNPVSTYDIVRRILDHYRKGCSFLTLLTEVNLVRRTPRRLLASVLSGYTAFHPRANRWTFDPKKEPEGFDKRKTGDILKR